MQTIAADQDGDIPKVFRTQPERAPDLVGVEWSAVRIDGAQRAGKVRPEKGLKTPYAGVVNGEFRQDQHAELPGKNPKPQASLAVAVLPSPSRSMPLSRPVLVGPWWLNANSIGSFPP